MIEQPNILIIGKNSFIGNSYEENTKFKNREKISLRNSTLEELSFSNYQALLHLPAIVHQSSKIPYEKYHEVNTTLAYETARKAKEEGVKHFVFFSTIRVYGEYTKRNETWDEETPPSPTDNYGRSKLEAEKQITALSDDHFTVSILRIPMVYGPGNRGNINKMIHFIEKFRFSPFSRINNERNVLYIKNLVDFLDEIIQHRTGGLFVVTDPNPVSTSEIADNICKHIDKKILTFSIPGIFRFLLKSMWRAGYYKIFGNLKLDCTESFERVAFEPGYNFGEGIAEMMEWYKNNQKAHRQS
jgi:UDP-glucose 4-epimerase